MKLILHEPKFSKIEKLLPEIVVKEIEIHNESRTVLSGSIHFQAIDSNCLGRLMFHLDYPQKAMSSGSTTT